VEASVDKLPYDFWPRLSWTTTSLLPPLNLVDMKKNEASKAAWLSTGPHMPTGVGEAIWHGVKLLGAGAIGAAGLWVETDASHNIQDVSACCYRPIFSSPRD
jgi:hypothetical protein